MQHPPIAYNCIVFSTDSSRPPKTCGTLAVCLTRAFRPHRSLKMANISSGMKKKLLMNSYKNEKSCTPKVAKNHVLLAEEVVAHPERVVALKDVGHGLPIRVDH